jgi:Uma2 family endonuclease
MVAKKLLSASEFYLNTTPHAELVDGEVIEYMPPSRLHSKYVVALLMALVAWAEESQAGEIGTEAGFVVKTNPDRVRSPDVYFIAKDRIAEGESLEGFSTTVPNLVIEVISPSDTLEVIREKLADYFGGGVQSVWLVYPTSAEVEIHTGRGKVEYLGRSDSLRDPVLGGFKLDLAELFKDA